MNKKIVMLVSYIVLLLILSFTLVQFKDVMMQSPFQHTFELTNVTSAVTDAEGNVYVVEGHNQLIKFNSEGMFQYEKTLDINTQIQDIAVDLDGRLYTIETFINPDTSMIQAETVVQYTKDGKKDSQLFSRTIESDSGAQERALQSIQVTRNKLLLYSTENKNLILHSINIDNKKREELIHTAIPEDHYIQEVAGISPETTVYSTKRGEIYKINSSHNPVLIYSNNNSNLLTDIGRGVPVHLVYGYGNDIYFFDKHNREVVRILLEDSSIQVVQNEQQMEEQGFPYDLSKLANLNVLEQGNLTIAMSDKVIQLSTEFAVEKVAENASYSKDRQFFTWVVWFIVLLFLVILVSFIRFLYITVLHKRVSLIIKQIVVTMILVVIAFLFLTNMIFGDFREKAIKDMEQQLLLLANTGQGLVDGDKLQLITTQDQYMQPEYKSLLGTKQFLTQQESLQTNGFINISIYKLQNDKLYSVIDSKKSMFEPVLLSDNMKNALLSSSPILVKEGDEYRAIASLTNSSGDVVGIFQVAADAKKVLLAQRMLKENMQNYILISSLGFFLLLTIITYFMLRGIGVLRNSVNEIASGKWDTEVLLHTHDEIEDLSERVKYMSDNVKRNIEEMKALSKAYLSFVPQKFIHFLGKESILDVEQGDQIEQNMSLMVVKVRSFYSLSQTMTPEENFSFINSFLSRFGPIIQEHDGIISKYLGAGVLAFFPDNTDQVVKSAIELQKELQVYNGHRSNCNYPPVELGVGIHKGSVRLGIIGEKERFEGVLISENVNVTEELEKLSEQLGASTIITEEVLGDLEGKENLLYRSLGLVQIVGPDKPITLYDLYDGDADNIKRLKEETKILFERAIYAYQEGRFYDARTLFVKIIKRNPHDKAAKLYFFLCDEYYHHGTPDQWDSTFSI